MQRDTNVSDECAVFISMPKFNRDGSTSLKAEKREMASGKLRGKGKVERMKFEPTGTMYSKYDVWFTMRRNSVWIRKTN
jgi:hypothetical protein